MKIFKILVKILKYFSVFFIITDVYPDLYEQKFICENIIEQTTDIRYQNFANRIKIFADQKNDCINSPRFNFCILDAKDSSKCYQNKEFSLLVTDTNSSTKEIKFDEEFLNESIDPLLNNLSIKYVIEKIIKDSNTITKAHLVIPTVDGNLKLATRDIKIDSHNTIPTCTQDNDVSNYEDCVYRTSHNSKILASVLGANITCIRDGIYNQFFKIDPCNKSFSFITNVWNFRNYLENSVIAVITLYVITIGFQILASLSNQNSESREAWDIRKAILVVLKVIFVFYFSIGLSSSDERGISNTVNKINGIEEIVLPLSLEIIDKISNTIFSNFSNTKYSQTGLCNFSPISNYSDFRFYMWDILECRLLYYLGSNSILGKFNDISWNLNIENIQSETKYTQPINNISHDWVPSSLEKAGNLNLLTVIGYMLLIPNFQIHIVLILLFLVLVLLSFIMLLIAGYILSILIIFLIGYISPILVLFFLFKTTENIFFASCRVLFSCILLPLFLSALLPIVFTIYDSYLQDSCEFNINKYILRDFHKTHNQEFYTFTIASNGNTTCKDSLMYQLQEYFYGHNWARYTFLVFFHWIKIVVHNSLIADFFQLLFINILFLIILQKFTQFISRSFNIGSIESTGNLFSLK